MIRYYFKIALRSLSKNRIPSIINIGGLTVDKSIALYDKKLSDCSLA
jgi:hypothetical protein